MRAVAFALVGTAKRERKKANKAARNVREARQQRVDDVRHKATKWGITIVVALGLVVGIAALGGAFSSEERSSDESAESTDASEQGTSASETETSEPSVECPPADGSANQQQSFDSAPPICIDADASYSAEIVTNKGTLVVELDQSRAPLTVNNFVTLARYHYFDNTECHRIIPGFMAQCGDPTATGTGGPGYQFADELPEAGEYQIGSLAMANSGPDTNGSQFFIISGATGVNLPPNYTLFGQVTEGLDSTLPALDSAGNPESNGVPPLEQVIIESVTIIET
jgi:cyclophilin family peptidyl-prolyl cis-trans isomerase